ncbi:MAG TPA: MlaD family protein [Tepidisphaeraceae bacterium]|jgi:ABC-type transporter Mla subunit MlaD|nr:MlaD family protein [Tepidisphaeraceae bacterium]
MTRDRNALKAGLFIVVGFVAAVATVLLIRGEGAGPTRSLDVSFKMSDDLGGLTAGDDVRAGGVKIGVVQGIRLKDLDTALPTVVVTFSIPTSYALREGARIGVQSALTGSPNLNITTFGAGVPLPDGTTLTGTADTKNALLARLGEAAPHIVSLAKKLDTQTLPKIDEAVASFKDTANSANTLVRHVDAKIDPAIARYEGVAQHAGEVITQVHDVLGDSRTDIRGALKNLNLALQSVNDKLPVVLEDLQKAVANARDLTASGRSVLTDNHDKLDGIIKSLKTTSDNLKAMSVEVRHSPWRLLYKPSPDEMGNLNLYDSARQFSEGAGSLSDAALALRDAMHDPNADKALIQKLLEHLDESFKKFHVAEDKLWTAVKE